jgi:hypothetical protein
MAKSPNRASVRQRLRRRYRLAKDHVRESEKFVKSQECHREMARRWLRLLRQPREQVAA